MRAEKPWGSSVWNKAAIIYCLCDLFRNFHTVGDVRRAALAKHLLDQSACLLAAPFKKLRAEPLAIVPKQEQFV